MDKYEYKLKLEQIQNMVEEKDYKTAAKIADTINWKKVKNVSTLCMVGEIYEQTKQFQESREVLLTAYDRSPVGRNIIYRLTLVAIKMKNLEEAQDYYEEFLEIAPHDNLKYVLRYELAKARGAAPAELIAILEELKEREFTEEWAFELAYLYHKSGNGDKCVELCDELVLWFGNGKYVEKALELKMLYQPLNKAQEEKYRSFKEGYNVIDLQKELAKGMQQIANATRQDTVNDTLHNMRKLAGVSETVHPEAGNVSPAAAGSENPAAKETPHSAMRKEMAGVLSEEYDGQISLKVPEAREKIPQITGQMSIEDILAEWEKTKEATRAAIAEAEQRRLEETRAKALREAEELMEQLAEQSSGSAEAVSGEAGMEEGKTSAMEEILDIDDGEEEFDVEAPDMANAAGIEETASEEPDMANAAGIEEADSVAEAADQDDEALEQRRIMQELLQQQERERQNRRNREEEVLKREITLEDSGELNAPLTQLNEKQKKIFTYFTLISGMEQQVCQALEGAYQRKCEKPTSAAGNLAIMGGKGSGKTALATDFIKAYQQMNGLAGGKVGKISAVSLNQKDAAKMFAALEGGYMIIEHAGDLSRESVEKLSRLMDQDNKGLMVILEDDKDGIEKVLSRSAGFARKFTERIRIPIFTSDELVAFARAYAREQKCEIDDMGILALYNSISNIQKLDEATTLTEVKEIVDEAIYHAHRGGLRRLFGGKRTTEDGLTLIREKDFDI